MAINGIYCNRKLPPAPVDFLSSAALLSQIEKSYQIMKAVYLPVPASLRSALRSYLQALQPIGLFERSRHNSAQVCLADR